MGIGIQIRKYRKRAKLTLERLSEVSGVEPGTISALEKRDSNRSEHFQALAKAFGLTLEQLVDETAEYPIKLATQPPSGQGQVIQLGPQPEDSLKIELLNLFSQLDPDDKLRWLGDLRGYVRARRPHSHGAASAMAGK